uniref:heme exporter protein CcmB n=1 Tax=Thaumasiovibrio occultus TaxID=1891184 RepID=UPI000B34BDDB|nr:heme exporter protein CcmB [Thaumasiovibrio occultus]
MMKPLWSLWRRELAVAMRRKTDLINPLWFFVMVITLFPLAIGPYPEWIARIGPGVLWVAALLSVMLSLDRLFKDDYRDGTLEQLLLQRAPLPLLCLVKVAAHWVLTGLPLILLSPLLALMLGLDMSLWWAIVKTLLLGTPTLCLLGAVGEALTVGLQKGGVLLSLLVLPLFIPVLIFASTAIEAAQAGLSIHGHLALLASLLVAAITLTPLAIAASLRVSLQ